MDEIKQHIITAFVEHKPGVLQRIASLFSRRKYNIDSISVGATENPRVARMTIITSGSDKILEQVEKQMNKLANVIRVSDLARDASICRELCIVKINAQSSEAKSQVIQYADVFRGNIVDVSRDNISVEITGDSDKIDAFINLVRSLGIKEVARTGVTAIQRG
jgi:acetolactate synthase-1/3 small subunit